MKKFIASILAVLYLSTSIGAPVCMHYCMGKPAGWGLGYKESKDCGKCGMEKSNKKDNGCCNDEHKFIKNNSDQKLAESSFQFMQFAGTAFLSHYAELPSVQIASLTEKNPVSNAPPRSSHIAIYILNRTFLI